MGRNRWNNGYLNSDHFGITNRYGMLDLNKYGMRQGGLFATKDSIDQINNELATASTTSYATIWSVTGTAIDTNTPFTRIATPRYGAQAEGLTGTTSLSNALGQFRYDLWSSAITVSSGWGDARDGKSWLGMAIYGNYVYYGIVVMMFPNLATNGTARIQDMFTGSAHSIYHYLVSASGTESSSGTALSASNSWNFSNNQQPGTQGYNLTTRFSADDGVWGVNPGGAVDGNTPGPSLVATAGATGGHGIENYNAGDSYSNGGHWRGQMSSLAASNYAAIVFTHI
jgi:hypothetical protein